MTTDAPRFRSSGAIVTRERADGTIWCPKCRTYLPRARFCRNKARKWSHYCHTCHFRAQQERWSRKPEVYARMLARERITSRRRKGERGAAVHREYLAMTQVAIERLRAIGLRYVEIARLCHMQVRVLEQLRKPGHPAKRPTMDRVLALMRVASDIAPGPNRASRSAAHDYYDVLERRMVEPLREIAEARRQGKYRQALGARSMT